MTKVCKRCGQDKPLADYYRHSKMADGHLGFCKECTKTRVGSHRSKHLDRIRAYDRERSRLPHRIAAASANTAAWRHNHPERYRAHTMVNNAVRDGNLVRLPCERCGNPQSHAHHEDYSKPLDVMWLCAPCHKQRHKELEAA